LLGALGDAAVTGKPAGDDLREGKRTVLIAHALAGLTEDDARQLDAGLGTPLDEAAGAQLQGLLRRAGAGGPVEELIDSLTQDAGWQPGAGLGTPLAETAVAQLQDRLRRSGAVETVEKLIDSLTEDAFAALGAAPVHPQAREELRELALAAVRREL